MAIKLRSSSEKQILKDEGRNCGRNLKGRIMGLFLALFLAAAVAGGTPKTGFEKELYGLLDKLSENDNPVLFVFDIKQEE